MQQGRCDAACRSRKDSNSPRSCELATQSSRAHNTSRVRGGQPQHDVSRWACPIGTSPASRKTHPSLGPFSLDPFPAAETRDHSPTCPTFAIACSPAIVFSFCILYRMLGWWPRLPILPPRSIYDCREILTSKLEMTAQCFHYIARYIAAT
ncbi:hypothetical protein B0T25DRAFT_230765 [Lasiosphaeria hispida]|uniref:Uncharacterized protein n=1 Tax=Lasiosphaeria hispida TaxID=260671 RepID=A0AAJ0MBW2_9PEZI|nr:hypothetical protein B0T25DRAFT_230765 [Lasiosphaeria hispida]